MSDDLSKVDWGKPIEAYHEDGRVVEAQFGSHASGGTASVKFMGRYENALKPSGYVGNGWRIRNVAEPVQAPSDPIAKRMEALVREIADGFYMHGVNDEGITINQAVVKAQAIVALLPEPVDADLVEVRRIVANALPEEMRPDILSGAKDHTASIQAPLACLKAGRALERDSREG